MAHRQRCTGLCTFILETRERRLEEGRFDLKKGHNFSVNHRPEWHSLLKWTKARPRSQVGPIKPNLIREIQKDIDRLQEVINKRKIQ